jgi:xylulokinase
MGQPLSPSLRAEAPALAAAILAGTGAGLFPSVPDAVAQLTRLAPTVEPCPPAAATYAELQNGWSSTAEQIFPTADVYNN